MGVLELCEYGERMVRTSEDVSTASVSCRDRGLKFVFSAAGGCATMVDDAGLLRRGEQRTHTQLQVLMLQSFPGKVGSSTARRPKYAKTDP